MAIEQILMEKPNRLLDLTARNRLLNLHEHKGSSLSLFHSDLDECMEQMSSKQLRFTHVPEPTQE